MARHLIKAPLIALIFAALWHFAMTLSPVSQGYSEVLGGFTMPRMGYVFMIAYGLWLSVIAAIVYANARDKGIKLFLLASVSFMATQWLAPMLPQLRFGETTGVMSFTDTLFKITCGCAAILFLLVLAALLFKAPAPPPNTDLQHAGPVAPEKYRVRKLRMVIMFIVLPVIYCVINFLVWYFLLWRSDVARAFYSGPADAPKLGQALVDIILLDAKQIPMSLIKGLVYGLALLPMLFQLAPKRAMFMASTVMLLLGVSIQMLIPSPVMPDAVRMVHVIELAAELALYGIFASILLRAGMRKPEPAANPVEHAGPVAKAPEAQAKAVPNAPAKK